jgi:hypothetical protein
VLDGRCSRIPEGSGIRSYKVCPRLSERQAEHEPIPSARVKQSKEFSRAMDTLRRGRGFLYTLLSPSSCGKEVCWGLTV